MCSKVEAMIVQDRRVKISVIAYEQGISADTVFSIIHSVLIMSVSSRQVPRTLTPEQKAYRQQFSEGNLDIFRANPKTFISRIITGDETCVHNDGPETKQESMQQKHKKFRVQQSAGMIMLTVFWESEGVLLLEFLPHKITITGDIYASTYGRITNKNAVESCRLVSCCFMTMHPHASHTYRGLLQENVTSQSLTIHPTVHTWLPATTFSSENIKVLRGRRFPHDNAAKEAVTEYFDTQYVYFF